MFVERGACLHSVASRMRASAAHATGQLTKVGRGLDELPRGPQLVRPSKTRINSSNRYIGGGGNSVTPAKRVRRRRSVFAGDVGRRRCCRRTRTPRLKVSFMNFAATSSAPL